MWVIYNAQTGIEHDRVEHYGEAADVRDALNRNEYGTAYNIRWEE